MNIIVDVIKLTFSWKIQILNRVFFLGKFNSFSRLKVISFIVFSSSINIKPPPTEDIIFAGDNEPIAASPNVPAFFKL